MKKNNLLKLVLVSTIFFCTLITPSFAFAASKETTLKKTMITTSNLNIRLTDNTKGKIIGWYKNKTKIQVLAKTANKWYRVNYKGKKGYVSGRYVKAVNTPAKPKAPAPAISKIVNLNVPLVKQLPELPTGCEITSVTMMLQFAGKRVNKVSLAKEMKKHSNNPNYGFVGNPFSRKGWTIYPQALTSTVTKYVGSSKNLTGSSLNGLKNQLNKKRPIVAWVSNFHGFTVHAIVLTGYDKNYFYYNDCWTGKKNVKISQSYFNTCWSKQAKRAISY
ncbi:C39 family peptidase [Listeria monocytogenes]|uniref:C39 family peptidase n=1 Tax=Listeria monocytogenes TaxID=1639 RepID=UPI0012D4D1D5|nr:C39 family peptidase [Listeria monocytogenes]ECC0312018.1 SH3 domain-containing protein [Listeria monocytogenes]EJQ3348400.1 C39 family peptidase [Listeria monocytogenes]EJS6011755.1 C39 family peptidase [Listeria monocytogenes]EJS6022131.1 C39 family peptidase [Listeria monocytogenes]EJS6044705.1 C39 family peptidase [Listeria monocytogenes]